MKFNLNYSTKGFFKAYYILVGENLFTDVSDHTAASVIRVDDRGSKYF
jgi:muramidase (phage lysozyme)